MYIYICMPIPRVSSKGIVIAQQQAPFDIDRIVQCNSTALNLSSARQCGCCPGGCAWVG